MANLDSTPAPDPGRLVLIVGPASQAATQLASDEASSSNGELSRPSSVIWKTTLHGSCPRCHHWHDRFKLRLSRQPGRYNAIKCAACSHILFGLGGDSTHLSLLSRETISIRSASWTSSVQACTDEVLRPTIRSLINTSSRLSAPGSPAISEQSRRRGSGTPVTTRRPSPLIQSPLVRPPSRGDTVEAAHEASTEIQGSRTILAPALELPGPASVSARQHYTLAESSKRSRKRFQPLRKGVKAILLHFGYTIQRVDRLGRPHALATGDISTAHAGVRAVPAPSQVDAPPPECIDHPHLSVTEGPELTGRGVNQETQAPESSAVSCPTTAVDVTPGVGSSESSDVQLPEEPAEPAEPAQAKVSGESIRRIRKEKTEAAKRSRKCECTPSCHCKKRSSSTGATRDTILPSQVPDNALAENASAYHSSMSSAASSDHHRTPRPSSADPTLRGVGEQFPTPQVSHDSLTISEEDRGRELYRSNRASSTTYASQATTLQSGQSFPRVPSQSPADVPLDPLLLPSRTHGLVEEEDDAVDGQCEVDGEGTPREDDSGAADVEDHLAEDLDGV